MTSTPELGQEPNWSIREVKARDGVYPTQPLPGSTYKVSPVTRALILAAPFCGYNKITQLNWAGVAERLNLLQIVEGPLVELPGGGKAFITPKDVVMHVGLTVVTKNKTKGAFGQAVLELAAKRMHMTSNKGALSAHESVNLAFDKEVKILKGKAWLSRHT